MRNISTQKNSKVMLSFFFLYLSNWFIRAISTEVGKNERGGYEAPEDSNSDLFHLRLVSYSNGDDGMEIQ